MPGASGVRRVYLLGQGISYSASPDMHNAAFHALGMDWTYELLEVPSEEVPSAVLRLREDDVAGANVTIPHKISVIDHLDSVDPEALRARAVNTIANEAGRLVGSNTDVAGIRTAIEDVGVEPRGANVVILGAGGHAPAAPVALDGGRGETGHPRPDDARL